MTYSIPSHDSLLHAINHLTYDYTGKNPDRLDLIKLIQHMASLAKNSKQLAGLLVYGLEIINSESYIAPKKQSWGLWQTGSNLYDTFERGLHVDKNNQLTDAKKTIYLSSLLQLAEQNSSEIPGLLKKVNFTANIKKSLKTLLKNSQEDVSKLKKKRPSATAMIKNFKEIPEKYRIKKENHAGRDKYIEFITILERECVNDNLDLAKSTLKAHASTVTKESIGFTVRFGAILYLMQQIEEEYTLTSPANSYLYQLCQHALNIQHSKEVSPLDKLTYYGALANQIPKVNPTDNEETSWEDKDFRKSKSFFLPLQNKLNDLTSIAVKEVDSTDPHPHIARLRCIIENATSLGVNVCTTNLATTVMPAGFGKSIISGGSSMVGLVFFGPQAAVAAGIIGLLGAFIEKYLFPQAVNRLSYRVFNSISHAVSKTTGGVVYYTLAVPVEAVYALGSLIQHKLPTQPIEVKPHNDMEWILSLLTLPDDVLPQADKKVIQTIAELAPAKDEVESTAALVKRI